MDAVRRGPTGIEGGADCASCPLAVDGKPKSPVAGVGPDDPEWIVIGEGPGHREVERGLPFVGATGEVLNRALRETGTNRNKLWVTNTASCRTDVVRDDTRQLAAIACRGRLNAELAMFPGKPLLLLGGVVTKEIVPSKLKITRLTGTYHELDVDDSGTRVVIPSLHPAYFLHSGGGKSGSGGTAAMGFINLKFDINKVKAVAAGRNIKLDFEAPGVLQTEIADARRANVLAQQLLIEATRDGFLGIDLETYVEDEQRNHALQGIAARINLLGLSTRARAVSVVWNLLTPLTKRRFAAALASPYVTKCYQNMIYEHSVLQNPHYRFIIGGPQEDTMLGHHAAFPGSPHGLQAIVCQFRGAPAWKAEFRDGDESLIEEADYNAKDVYGTVKTLEPVHFWIKKTNTQSVYDVDRKKAALAAKMHLWGYHVDGDVNHELTSRFQVAIAAAREQLLETFETNREKVIDRLAWERAKTRRKADPEDYVARQAIRRTEEDKAIAKAVKKGEEWFAPGKDMHMIALLKVLGVPLLKLTETGRTSTSADVLEDLAHFPAVASLLRYRSNEKLLGTFVIRMFEWVQDSQKKWRPPFVQDDGRVHPIWSVNKLSGRWGSEEPGSQNWSRGDELNKDLARRLPNIRRQATAPLGRRIVAFDLAQLEARTMALQSDDPFLCKVFAESRDIHGEFALLIFPEFAKLDPSSLEYTAQRDVTKRLEYGGLYGGADETVWKSIVVDFPHISLGMVSAAIRKMKQVVAGVLRWQQELFLQCEKPPYELHSYVLKRRRVFPMGNPSPTDVNNNPNQFTGADIMDLGTVRFMEIWEKARWRDEVMMLKQVHDAAYFEVPDDDKLVNEIGLAIRDAWTQTHHSASGIAIEFPIDLKHGYALHDQPKPSTLEKHPELDWGSCGRPGLVKLKLY